MSPPSKPETLALTIITALLLVACNGGTSSTAEPDAAVVTDTPLGLYCTAASDLLGCADLTLSDCERSTIQECNEVFEVERQEYLLGRSNCGFPADCAGFSDFAQRDCLYKDTENMPPTAAQNALADTLCMSCAADDVVGCLSNFFYRAPPVEGGAGVSGQGASFITLNEDMVATISAACVPAVGADQCWPGFFTCVKAELEATYPTQHVEACMVGPSPS